ncbi:2-C-methyl-D-erythritol 2,4-cyclodiphosphate synthase [Trueperella sp.]|uniref:2-C-methyl-D-erythritol 2,4-cyclodiphosphate synthase n=1 Tax=Trueperella sp. TaxID=2699835 RepID=UPI003735AF0E
MTIRVATAFDAHKFSDDPRRPLWLGCLEWEGLPGLVGHSDADVAAHAACDALLMATGIGELGTIFGTGRPEWDGASGETLLRESVKLVHEAGWEIANVSVQIIGQRPRFASRKAEAEAAMSQIVGAPVVVSATTSDRMGFTGRDEGLAAIATALVTR